MDPQFQNNLARGLGAVAETFGQYAMAAHAERLQTAKENFASMLDDKKQAAIDARDQANETQRAQDRAAAATLARQQHQDDKEQQDNQFNQRLAMDVALHNDTNARLTASEQAAQATRDAELKIQQRKEAREAAGNPKAPTQASLMEKVKYTDKALADAQDAFSQMKGDTPKDQQVTTGTAYGRALADAKAARAAAGLSAPVEITVGAHATPGATAPAAPTPPQIKYDAAGKAYIRGPDGKPVLYNPQSSADGSTPPDGSQPADASPSAASAGAYAQAQPDPAATDPASAPPLGAPDPNNPQLAG